MKTVSEYMRITSASVSDSEVDSRKFAALNLAKVWGNIKTPNDIFAKSSQVSDCLGGDGTPLAALGDEVQLAIQKKSSSFLYSCRPLDVGVVSGIAIGSMLEEEPSSNGLTVKDVYATAIWSSLAYQPALEDKKRENLRADVLKLAEKWALKSAENARARTTAASKPLDLKIVTNDTAGLTSDFTSVISKILEPLWRNAALDREELDFLWWAQLGHSRLLKRPWAEMTEATRLVAAGIEGAKILRRLPCDVHREIILRFSDGQLMLDLSELVLTLGSDRETLGSNFNETIIESNQAIFPLIHALATGKVNGAGSEIKRTAAEWGSRALLEATFFKMCSQGISKL
jgi:GTPase-associated system helical domain